MSLNTPPNFENYNKTRQFGSLNGLRFLCISAVLWHHFPIWAEMENGSRLLSRGFTGVDFFFVLSGYLITTLLLREAATHGLFSLRAFYWRRCLRIIPIYFLVVTLVGSYYIVVKGESAYLAQLPFYYLFLSNFLIEHIPFLGPTWSLSVEEQYYLFWPILLLLAPKKALIPIISVLVLVNVAAALGWLSLLGISAFELGPLRFAIFNATYAPILIGSASAILLQNPRSFATLARILGGRTVCLWSFALVICFLAGLPEDLIGFPNLALHFAMAMALISIVIREDHILRSILTWGPIARVGEISYGIYLYHLIALHVATVSLTKFGVSDSGLLVLFTYIFISVVMAEVSFRTLERWFSKWKYHVPGNGAVRQSQKNT